MHMFDGRKRMVLESFICSNSADDIKGNAGMTVDQFFSDLLHHGV